MTDYDKVMLTAGLIIGSSCAYLFLKLARFFVDLHRKPEGEIDVVEPRNEPLPWSDEQAAQAVVRAQESIARMKKAVAARSGKHLRRAVDRRTAAMRPGRYC